MPKARKHAAHLSSNPNDLEAAFYEALQAGDLERLMACWADDEDIVCIHLGGSRIVGTAAIRAAFEAMFSEGGTINAHPEHFRRVNATASAAHCVVEKIEVLTPEGRAHAHVLATNVYHKTPRMAHGGAPCQPRNARCSIRRAAARAGTALMQNRTLAPVYIA